MTDFDPNIIQSFFDEAAKLRSKAPKQNPAKERKFYELWESVRQPRPFKLVGENLNLLDKSFTLPAEVNEWNVFFVWNPILSCPDLILEGGGHTLRYNLISNGDSIEINFTGSDKDGESLVGEGEKLEIALDVLAYIRDNEPKINALGITKKHFLEILRKLKSRHDRKAVATVRKLLATDIKNLIKQAAEDMAIDELGPQLLLPLDGDYFATSEALETEKNEVDPQERESHSIPKRTPWEIREELAFLTRCSRLVMEHEIEFVLSFEGAEILQEAEGNKTALRLPVTSDIPCVEGERLKIQNAREGNFVGQFIVDLFDGTDLYGRWEGDFPEGEENWRESYHAKPPRSPNAFIHRSLEELTQQVQSDKPDIPKGISCALGFEESPLKVTLSSNSPQEMNQSQALAWSAAVGHRNSVVLIQGPPGTGKTWAMEQVLRQLSKENKRILVTAPTNTAVDNVCERILDLPVLRLGNKKESLSAKIANSCWSGSERNLVKFHEKRENCRQGAILAGTHVGLLKDELLAGEIDKLGVFDVILFDEAGMTKIEEFLLCARLGKRLVLFGDQKQLPPFPVSSSVLYQLKREFPSIPNSWWQFITKSALEWLSASRDFPLLLMRHSYRCQNPRLLRFSSTLFYDARIKASARAEYYRLPYLERQKKYPPATLRLYRTSGLALKTRSEQLLFEGSRPGLENPSEARICAKIFYDACIRYPLDEISVIAPYRRQIRLIRKALSLEKVRAISLMNQDCTEKQWENFLRKRISTVDSFQGAESDVVIISYTRSNRKRGIGFVDDPNRTNVAHTRCRRELLVIGDLDCLKKQAKNKIFHRLETAVSRDGEIIDVTKSFLKKCPDLEPDEPLEEPAEKE